jgi:hypothetical protein
LLHTNRLTMKKLLIGMKSVNSEFSEHDLDLLLSILDCQPKKVSPSLYPPSPPVFCADDLQMVAVSKKPTVDYVILLERIARAEKVIKMDNIRKKTKNLNKCIPPPPHLPLLTLRPFLLPV